MACGFYLIDFVISEVYEARAGSTEQKRAHILPSSLYSRCCQPVYIINGRVEISWQAQVGIGQTFVCLNIFHWFIY